VSFARAGDGDGDGADASVAAPEMKVWGREDLELHSAGEKTKSPLATGGGGGGGATTPARLPLAWQPRGALLAAAIANEVVFFERNGLLRGGFELPSEGVGVTVTRLAWSKDSNFLAVVVAKAPDAHDDAEDDDAEHDDEYEDDRSPSRRRRRRRRASRSGVAGSSVQIWTRGNMHWYLKRERAYGVKEGVVHVEWDDDDATLLRVVTAAGAIETHAHSQDVDVSLAATVAVIDGPRVLVTPLARTPTPPPLAAATCTVRSIHWFPYDRVGEVNADP